MPKRSVPKFIAIDTETVGTHFHSAPDKPWVFAVSMCDWKGLTHLFVWKVDPFTRTPIIPKNDVAKIQAILDRYPWVVMHNARFDTRALATIGITIPFHKIHDTLIASHVLDNIEDHGLKPLAEKYLKIPNDDEKALKAAIIEARKIGKKFGWKLGDETAHDSWMPELVSGKNLQLRKYALLDAERTAALFAAVYWPILHKQNLWDQYLDHLRAFPAIYNMESCGISLRKQVLSRERSRYLRIAHAKTKIAEGLVPPDFNVNSGPQLQVQLYGRWKLPVLRRTKTAIATDAGTLHTLLDHCRKGSRPHTFITAILEEKRNLKAAADLESFKELAVEREGLIYLHPSVNQTGTRTTRVSAYPQNVGKGADLKELGFSDEEEIDFRLRLVFGPAKNRVWYSYDYDQLQLRIFAHVSGEENMVRAFAQGWDAHNYVASQIFKTDKPTKLQRRIAKNVNFGFIFGAQPAKIEATAGVPGLWSVVTKLFPNAHDFMDKTKAHVKKHGYVTTMGGYRLYLPLVLNKWSGRMEPKHYAGVCYIVQGTEGELVKDAMVRVNNITQKNPDHNFIMQVHDELVFDMPSTTRQPHQSPERKLLLQSLQQAMVAAGDRYGVVTKVNCELIKTSWADGTPLTL